MTRTRNVSPGSTSSHVEDAIEVVLQPVIEVATGSLRAVEALARFPGSPGEATDEVLARAHADGSGPAREAACLRAALKRRGDVPDGVRLAVNVSPDMLHHPDIVAAWPADLDGVVVEVTEHAAADPQAVTAEFARLRGIGASIAVDDVGTGYAGLLRLAMMRPDFVKIDRTIVAGARHSNAQQAVLESLVMLSHRLGAAVISEGVETLEDLVLLARYDSDYAQGWAVGQPVPIIEPIDELVVAVCLGLRRNVLQRDVRSGQSTSTTESAFSIATALSAATGLADLHRTTRRAAEEIGVDTVGVSVLDRDGMLHEISSTGAIDTSSYAPSEYPTTMNAIQTGQTAEVHLADAGSDPAEAALLRSQGHVSLLMVPLRLEEGPIGLLEFTHRTHRRWTSTDIVHAQGLADQLSRALIRII